MEKLIRLGITNISVTKPPFLEWKGGIWRVWTAYNNNVTSGTYVNLYQSGAMERVTVQDNCVTEITKLNDVA